MRSDEGPCALTPTISPALTPTIPPALTPTIPPYVQDYGSGHNNIKKQGVSGQTCSYFIANGLYFFC